MSIKHRWPARHYNFRDQGVSITVLKEPRIADIVLLCDHYDEMLDLYGKEGDLENYKYVKEVIA